MRTALVFTLLAVSLSSCYNWKRAFVPKDEGRKICDGKYADYEESELNAADFFYLRQIEYFELIDNDEEDDEPYTNEVSVALYESVSIDHKLQRDERIVEEKYMYLDGFSEPDSTAGKVYYFRTATYWGEGKNKGKDEDYKNKLKPSVLRDHYSNSDIINLSTSKELQMGSWVRYSDTLKLLLNDGVDTYEVLAKIHDDSLIFHKITYPNKEGSGKDINAREFIDLSKVMNVQNHGGLVYHRNVQRDTLLPQRTIVTTYVEGVDAKLLKVRKIGYNSRPLKRKYLDKGRAFLVLSDATGTILAERKRYHKTWVIPEDERESFLENGVIPTREELKEKEKKEKQEAKESEELTEQEGSRD